jgi:hypothetical protein
VNHRLKGAIVLIRLNP